MKSLPAIPDWNAIATSTDALTPAEAKAETFGEAIESLSLAQLKDDLIKIVRESMEDDD